jgi:hypothetical protein
MKLPAQLSATKTRRSSGYRTPLPESQKIAGLIAFYNEKLDIYVDGVLEERPTT